MAPCSQNNSFARSSWHPRHCLRYENLMTCNLCGDIVILKIIPARVAVTTNSERNTTNSGNDPP